MRLPLVSAIAEERRVRGRFKHAQRLRYHGDYEAALAECEAILERYAAHEAPEIVLLVAKTAAERIGVLNDLGRDEDVAEACDEFREAFGESEDPELEGLVAWCSLALGAALASLGREADADRVYAEIVERFGSAFKALTFECAITALLRQAFRAVGRGNPDQGLTLFAECVERLRSADTPGLRVALAHAMEGRALALRHLERYDETISAVDRMSRRLSRRADLAIQRDLVLAHIQKGLAQEALGHRSDAVATYDACIDRWGAAVELELAEPVAAVFGLRGHAIEDPRRRLEAYELAVEWLRPRYEAGATEGIALCYAAALAVVTELLDGDGRRDAARSAARELIERFDGTDNVEIADLLQEARAIAIAPAGPTEPSAQ